MKTFLPLTLEQLEGFPKEFPLFLASLGIDKLQWEKIKAEDSAKLAEVLEAFSALVWTDILGKSEYLEHRMKDGIACYFCGEEQMQLIYIRAATLDWTSASWYEALMEQWGQPSIDVRTGSKIYQTGRGDVRSFAQGSRSFQWGTLPRAFKAFRCQFSIVNLHLWPLNPE